MKEKSLNIDDLATLFGADTKSLDRYCRDIIDAMDLRYQPLGGKERDDLLLYILKRIENPELAVAGESRRGDWENGWQENLNDFISSNYDLRALTPKYYRKRVPVRLFGDYVMPLSDDFVFNVTHVFRVWIFQSFFTGKDNIFEFGCGSGQHLACLCKLFPDAACTGLDWARSSQEILSLLATNSGWHVRGRQFDFFSPDETMEIPSGSGVLTFGALEQTGEKYGAFLDMLIKKAPAVCVNIEGLQELYNPGVLTDYMALKYHIRRKYLSNYLTRLRKEDAAGRIRIIRVHHQRFGNMFDDPHSYVVWEPTGGGIANGA